MPLVIFGLLVSIPIIVWGSQLVLKLMDRFPLIITAGGMLLGWIAGTMVQTDPGLVAYIPQDKAWGYGLGVAFGLNLFAEGYGTGSIVAILLVGIGGGMGLQAARRYRAPKSDTE